MRPLSSHWTLYSRATATGLALAFSRVVNLRWLIIVSLPTMVSLFFCLLPYKTKQKTKQLILNTSIFVVLLERNVNGSLKWNHLFTSWLKNICFGFHFLNILWGKNWIYFRLLFCTLQITLEAVSYNIVSVNIWKLEVFFLWDSPDFHPYCYYNDTLSSCFSC